ncbi:MAG: DNA-formamidopyrimidine glycosylase family protein [Polyangiaceae bacterium]
MCEPPTAHELAASNEAMPEGHTIHRLARDLARTFAAKSVRISSPQGRFPEAASLDGTILTGAFAVGKHLFLDFDRARVHVHLGLFGRFKKSRPGAPPRPSVRLRIAADDVAWDLSGPTACALVDDLAYARLRERLGSDPLSGRTRSADVWKRIHRSRRAIGALLLDQSVIAGLGNVYRAEILFLVGLHPSTPGKDVPKSTFEAIWSLSKDLLARGVSANRIVTVPLDERRHAPRSRREQLYVYKRRTCRRCGSGILRSTVAQRTMYHCPVCQPGRHGRHDGAPSTDS